MLKSLIIILGRILALLPLPVTESLCHLLGRLLFVASKKRRRLLLSNLHHAFPEKPHSWLVATAKRSCMHAMELGMFNLAAPFLSKSTLRSRFQLCPEVTQLRDQMMQEKRPVLILTPHFSLMESQTLVPNLWEGPSPKVGIIYRPLKNRNLEEWVKKSRERFGFILLSRKKGFIAALKLMREAQCVGVLFDQNAGKSGVLTTSMGRVASCTELPALLTEKFDPHVAAFYPERTGFWQATLKIQLLEPQKNALDVVFAANQWLDEKLIQDEAHTAEWLWMHDRWRTQDQYHKRFRLEAKRMALEETKRYHGWSELPRKTRFWIRLPNWLGDIVMALPLIRTLRSSRPDAKITFLVKPQFIDLLKQFNLAEHYIALPDKKKSGYFSHFKTLAQQYPDTHILFTNSTRGDLEAKCIGAPQRFGMERPGKKRRTLTHTWKVPADLDETQEHQTRVWEQFFRHFGLSGEVDLSPFTLPASDPIDASSKIKIALFCGSENSPEKRWPIEYWQELLQQLSQQTDWEFYLLGTPKDRELTDAIAQNLKDAPIKNLAGNTSLNELATLLSTFHLAIGNDSGGMHIANALGLPLIGIYGPTNPVRTGPIFNTPHKILQPPGCPATGGSPITEIKPATVAEAALAFIENGKLKIEKHHN